MEENKAATETSAGWDSPGTEELAKAFNKAGVKFAEEKPGTEAPAEEKTPAPADEKQGAEERPREEGPSEETSASSGPKRFTIRGIDYTEDEIETFVRGGMRQADYTRKTQDLARERAELNRDREALDLRYRGMQDQLRRVTPEAAAAEDPIETLISDPDIPEPMAKALRLMRNQYQADLTGLQERYEQRELQARQDAFVDSALDSFETTFAELCQKHNVTDPLEKRLLRADIIVEDPDIEDPDELRASVEHIFEQTRRGLEQRAEKIRQTAITGLKKLPVPSPAKGGSPVPIKGAERPLPTFDDGNAVNEMQERLDRLRGVAK